MAPPQSAIGTPGVLNVVPESVLAAAIKKRNEEKVAADNAAQADGNTISSLAGFIRGQYEMFRWHRNNTVAGWSERLLIALRAFNGQYDATKLQEITKFGGSTVYARLISAKCRSASSLLRDIYLASDRSWSLTPPSDPQIPPEIHTAIQKLIEVELSTMQQAGAPINPTAVRDRADQLVMGARDAAKRKARKQADIAADKIDTILSEGGFYKALAEFLVDLPLFPFACIKGPEVRIVPTVVWENGKAIVKQQPKLCWSRVSPFDLWWTPGVADIEDAAVIERTRVSRADLNDLLDLPGYNTKEVQAVLDEYGAGGIADNWDVTDAERAQMESRENPLMNRSGMITCLHYSGNVQGRMLRQYGLDEKQVPDELRDYCVQAWLIGNHVIKAQLYPSPRKRHNYFITSFEKVPGTPVGNGLPDILSDVADSANATLRSLVNNLSISSGPQVVVNDERLAPGEDGEELFPWKRWHVQNDVMGNNTQAPISFFQPVSNAQELLTVYQSLVQMADEISAIPRYQSGGPPGSGPGRTASGLAMLMGNASKILQTVAANVDRDVFGPCLTQLFDLIMLTDTSGLLTGEETIRVRGVDVVIQRETQRSRQIEFLTATANPIDVQIIGPKGRATVLRAVAQNLGLDGEEIVPSTEELEAQQQQQQAQMAQMGAAAQGAQPAQNMTGDMGPRTSTSVPRIQGGV